MAAHVFTSAAPRRATAPAPARRAPVAQPKVVAPRTAVGVPRFAQVPAKTVAVKATEAATPAASVRPTATRFVAPPPVGARRGSTFRAEARPHIARPESPWEAQARRVEHAATRGSLPLTPSSVAAAATRADAPGTASAARPTLAHPGLGPSPPERVGPSTSHPLPPALRRRLEALSGYDLAAVRVVTGAAVAETARGLQARAFTQFGQIHLGPGASLADADLLAHETAHVLQQTLPAPQLARLGLTPAPFDAVLRQPFSGTPFADRRNAREALLDPLSLVRWQMPDGVRRALWWVGDDGLPLRVLRAVPEAIRPSLFYLRHLETLWRVVEQSMTTFADRQKRWAAIQAASAQTDDPTLLAAARGTAEQLPLLLSARWEVVKRVIGYTVRAAEIATPQWEGGMTSLAPREAAVLDDLAMEIDEAFTTFASDSWVLNALLTALGYTGSVRTAGAVKAWVNGQRGFADGMIQGLYAPAHNLVTAQFDLTALSLLTALEPAARSAGAELQAGVKLLAQPDALFTQRAKLKVVLPRIRAQIGAVTRGLPVPAQTLTYAYNTLGASLQNFSHAPAVTTFFATEFTWLDRIGGALDPWLSQQEPSLLTAAQDSLGGVDHWIDLVGETVLEAEVLDQEVPDYDAGGFFSIFRRAWAALTSAKDKIIAKLMKEVPLLRELVETAPKLWDRAKSLFGRFVDRIFKEGRILAPLWEFFLGVIGLEVPAEFVRDIAERAGSLLGKILKHPFRFLANLAKGISHGLHRFGSRIGEHLLSGLLEWFFGEFDLQPPFTFGRIAEALLKQVGLTVGYFCERIAVYLKSRGHQFTGPQVEERLRQAIKIGATALRWLKMLLAGDYAGFWEEVKNYLSEFWHWLVDKAVHFVVDTLKRKLIALLVQWLDPTGISQILSVIKAIYEAVKTVIQYLEKMWAIVRAVFGAIREIADGQIDRAATFVEEAAIKGLTVMIGFGANYFNLGTIVEPIRKALGEAKALVTRGMDGLIRLLGAAWDWLVGKAKQAAEWWKNRHRFKDDTGTTRELFYVENATGALLHISVPSARGQSQIAATPLTIQDYLTKELKPKLSTAREKQLYKEVEDYADEIDEIKRESDGSFSAARGEVIHVYFNEIALRLNEMAGIASVPPATVVNWETRDIYGDAHGEKMVAHPLSIDSGGNIGSKPVSSGTKLWEKVRTVYRGQDTAYIKGHLLNHHLHGPGVWTNMTPIARTTNSEMERIAEDKVKKAVVGQNRVVHYEVTMVYDPPPTKGNAAEKKLPREIVMEAYELKYKAGKWNEKGAVVLPRETLKNRVGET